MRSNELVEEPGVTGRVKAKKAREVGLPMGQFPTDDAWLQGRSALSWEQLPRPAERDRSGLPLDFSAVCARERIARIRKSGIVFPTTKPMRIFHRTTLSLGINRGTSATSSDPRPA